MNHIVVKPTILFTAALGVILGLAILANIAPPNLQLHYSPGMPLDAWLPGSSFGWVAVDKPIADTPEVKKAVAELLNFTDGAFRVYEKGGKSLSVYIAYWEPGKMDPRLVAVHSPDVCWVAGGWRMVGSAAQWAPSTAGGAGLGLGELRTFEASGQKQNVVFWHFIGGLPSGFMGRQLRGESFWSWGQILRNPRSPRFEQWFVRISTSTKLSDFEGDPLWDELLTKLSQVAVSHTF